MRVSPHVKVNPILLENDMRKLVEAVNFKFKSESVT